MIRNIILIIAIIGCHTAFSKSFITSERYVYGGEYYPGAEYSYNIYIPDGYTGEKEACLYLGFDGILCNAPKVFDELITKGAMPPVIGVFVNPGIIKTDDGSVIRYNRSNEYDSTDNRLALWVKNVLLKDVRKYKLPNGKTLKLSTNPDDCAVFGASSGGIAAFTLAWHRPDMFHRVFSAAGSFVSMRGGHNLHALIRKTEPKPLKIFIQDGSEDAWNPLFGHWYEGNKILVSALEFAGYDIRCDWTETGHSISRANEIFSNVMRWLWKDHSNPIKVGQTRNDFLSSLLIPEENWALTIQEPKTYSKSAIYPGGSLEAFAKDGDNMIWQAVLDKSGKHLYEQRFYALHSYDNLPVKVYDLTFDSNGNLYAATNWGIQICDQNGRVRGIIHIPNGLTASSIEITDGKIIVQTEKGAFSRKMNILKPNGTPKSQGQG